jgi:hypothetical protein
MSTAPDDEEATSRATPADVAGNQDGGHRRTGDDRSRWRRGTALVIVLAAAAGTGVWRLTQGASDPDPLADPREVAREFGAAYLTFDSGDLDGLGDRILELGTEDFVREYESARLPGVEQLFVDGEVATRAEVSDVLTTGIEDGRVRALVFVDIDARGPEGEQRLQNLSFVLELEAVDGEWLVDAVSPLPIPEVVGDGVPTTTSPGATTTAPAPADTAEGPTPAPAG